MDAFLEEIQEHDLAPLWEVYQNIVGSEPSRSEDSMIWKWDEMLPLIEKSAELVQGPDADHRVLILKNSRLNDRMATTTNILAAFQCVNPGEATSPHRHTPAATRIIIEGSGGGTFVDGKRCDMFSGDLIITPNWTWHCHQNDSGNRAIWLDVLDIPLVGSLDAVFGDMSMGPEDTFPMNIAQISDDSYLSGGLMPVTKLQYVKHSPRLRYSFQDTLTALRNAPKSNDGIQTVNYTNPIDGSAILPTHDAKIFSLSKSIKTLETRSTANAVCIVIKGTGSSEIGGICHQWSSNDVFTIPHWSWTTHLAASDEAIIIEISDRQIMEKLNLYRRETLED